MPSVSPSKALFLAYNFDVNRSRSRKRPKRYSEYDVITLKFPKSAQCSNCACIVRGKNHIIADNPTSKNEHCNTYTSHYLAKTKIILSRDNRKMPLADSSETLPIATHLNAKRFGSDEGSDVPRLACKERLLRVMPTTALISPLLASLDQHPRASCYVGLGAVRVSGTLSTRYARGFAWASRARYWYLWGFQG